MIIQPVETHAAILHAYLSSIFKDTTILMGGNIEGMETTPAVLLIRATFPDGIDRYAVTTADTVMFLWNFRQMCPILNGRTLYLWCNESRTGDLDLPALPFALQFSESPKLAEAFRPTTSSSDDATSSILPPDP